MQVWHLSRPRLAGGAIVETVIAMALVAMVLSGIHLTNAQVMQQVRSSLESVAASRDLSGRAEQLRASTWTQVTDPGYLQTNILSVTPDTGEDLGNLVETIEITAHLAAPGAVAPIKVRRTAKGMVTIVDAGDGTMQNQTSVRIDLTTAWIGKGGRARSREASLIVGQGGILGRN